MVSSANRSPRAYTLRNWLFSNEILEYRLLRMCPRGDPILVLIRLFSTQQGLTFATIWMNICMIIPQLAFWRNIYHPRSVLIWMRCRVSPSKCPVCRISSVKLKAPCDSSTLRYQCSQARPDKRFERVAFQNGDNYGAITEEGREGRGGGGLRAYRRLQLIPAS